MNIYLINLIIVVMMQIGDGISRRKKDTYRLFDAFCLGIIFLILFSEFAFQGDFTTDIRHYYRNFVSNYGDISIYTFKYIRESLFNDSEIGFRLLSVLVKSTTNSFLAFMIVVAIIISFGYTCLMKKYSEVIWLSFLVLLCSSSYYYGFNITKQIMASSLFCLCIKYIFDKNIIRYIISILLIATIHYSAFVLLPIYFIFTLKINNWNRVTIVFGVCLLGLIILMFPQPFQVISSFVYPEYSQENAYRTNEGVALYTSFKNVAISSFIVLNIKRFDLDNKRDRIIYIGCTLYFLLTVSSMRIAMMQRFMNFFVPFLMIGYPLVYSKYSNKDIRKVLIPGVLVVLSMNMAINPLYYLYVDNKYIIW